MDIEEVFPTELGFMVSARTMQMLGRESISSPVVGILELVKNAYDADATEVNISFCKASSKSEGFIVIEDNGKGMDLHSLVDKWLTISTDDKRVNSVTARGRVKVGEKGIGRLGLDRLSQFTHLLTFEKGENGILLYLDWNKYEKAKSQLTDIKHPAEKIHLLKDQSSGTILFLTGLRDQWTQRDYKELYDDLSLLVPPFQVLPDEFVIYFNSDEAPNLSGRISSSFASAAEFSLESELTDDGTIKHTITHRSGAVTTYSTEWSDAFNLKSLSKPACGPIKFLLYFYLVDSIYLKDAGVQSVDLRKYLNQYRGIRIYRDNFRVKPYGDPEGREDWLGINLRRLTSPGGVSGRKGAYRISENQVVGSVFISRDFNPLLTDQTNREGLVKNDAYRDMQKFILHGIQFLEIERQEQVRKERREKRSTESDNITIDQSLIDSEVKIRNITSELSQAKENLAAIPLFVPEESRQAAVVVTRATEALTQISAQIEQTRAYYAEEQTERQILLGLATLGIAMTTFGHEILRSVDSLTNRITLLSKLVSQLPIEPIREQSLKDLAHMEKAAQNISVWGKFALDRVRRDKRTQKEININDVIENVLTAFDGDFNERKIITQKKLSPNLPPFRAFAMDIEAVLINLMTNSVEAMRYTGLDERRIYIETDFLKETNEFSIIVADSGKGIRLQDINRIFDPLFSTKVDEHDNPIGTGMGLSIVENVVSGYNGHIAVEGKGRLNGAEFQVFLPDKKGR